jgi:Fe-S cluster assembly scaffold protein SufB
VDAGVAAGAFERWLALDEPDWAKVSFPRIDYQDSYYYAAPEGEGGAQEPRRGRSGILETYKKLGIPLREQEVLAGVVGAPEVRRGRGVRQRQRGHHLQEGAGRRSG